MSEQVQRWQTAAKRDEEMAHVLMENGFYEGAACHIQQSAFKLLRSLQIAKEIGGNAPNCVKTLALLNSAGLSTEDVTSFARKLDIFYGECRYPVNGAPSENFDETIVVDLFVCHERVQTFVDTYSAA